MDDLLCVIPARGGSKRVPRKNVLEMAGKPMIAYSIEAALETDLFDEVFVTTDDEEIAEISRAKGANVPELVPAELCGDQVPSHQPAQYLADTLLDRRPDTLVLLQPTSPLRIPSDISDGVEQFLDGNFEFVVSVTHIDPHYFHWAMKQSDDGYWDMHFGDKYMKERPLLPDRFRPNGSVKIADLDALRETGNFFGEKCGAFETPRRRSIHVGTDFEFEIAEALLERRETKWGME